MRTVACYTYQLFLFTPAAATAAWRVGHASCVVCATSAAGIAHKVAFCACHMQAALASRLVGPALVTLSAARAHAQEECVSACSDIHADIMHCCWTLLGCS